MSYGNSGLNRVSKDNSGFTPQQRHDIIMATLAEFGKGSQAFQLRWRENSGEYLTGDILLKTPMFWFMKYKWGRQEIETLFFKARIVIDSKFDMALQQTFGGDPGPRWKGGGGVKNKNWKRKQDVYENRDWKEADDEKKAKEDDSMEWKRTDPNFEYKPVIQPVSFNATGGVTHKTKAVSKKSYDHAWVKPTGDDVYNVSVQCPNGKTLVLAVQKDEPLQYVKKQIQAKSNNRYDTQGQKLFFNFNELLNDDASLESYGVSNDATLQLSMGPIQVFVEKKDGTKLEVMCPPHGTLAKLKKEIEKNTYPSVPAQEQQLFRSKQDCKAKQNELATNHTTLFNYGIRDGDTVYLGGPSVWRAPTGGDSYPVFVECPDGKTLTLNVTGKDDIGYTKLQIETLTNKKYPCQEQKLFFKTRELSDDSRTLSEHKIAKNAVLQLSNGTVPIFVETREGNVVELQVQPTIDTIESVKKQIESKTGEPVQEQQLFNKVNKQALADNAQTLFGYGITANSELYLGGTIPVQIRKPDGTITHLSVDPTQPCKQMKAMLESQERIPVRQQTLVFRKRELNDGKPCTFYNIGKGDIIDLKRTYPIFVENVKTKKRIKLDVSPEDSILSIKQRIENKAMPSVPVGAQTLIFKRQKIPQSADMAPIKQFNIVENSVIELAVDEDDPEALLEKILSRDAPAQERLEAVQKINDNLCDKNPKYAVLLAKDKIPLLVCGYSVQVLDEDHARNPVSKTAIEDIPNIFAIAADKDNDLAMGSLDETLDSLFKIYDDPKCRKLHPYARKAINAIVDNILARNEPKSVNKLVEKLGEKVDTENINTPEVRKFAMEQLQKAMFPPNSALLKKVFSEGAKLKEMPKVSEADLAKKGSAKRTWFDVAIGEEKGPTQEIGDKHRKDVAKAISEMITDPNRDNRQIGLNLADIFNQSNPKFKDRLDGHARPLFMKWKFGPLKDYNMKMPPKGPQRKSKVEPLAAVDYRISQQQDLTIAPAELPDL